MRPQDKIIIWPAYFDSTKTRKEGRRVPKDIAVPIPKITEIKEAIEKLRLNYELALDAAYPQTPCTKTGMLLVKKKEPKNSIVRNIAKQLMKIRSAPASETT